MRVLVIGGGGREHALVRALAADPAVSELHAGPGNPGMAGQAELHPVAATDERDVIRLARRLVGRPGGHRPGGAAGGGGRRRAAAAGFPVFGPDAARASSKAGRPSPRTSWRPRACPTAAPVAPTPAEVAAALDAFGSPYVVKHDELAAGKGVVVTDDRSAALAHAAARTGS